MADESKPNADIPDPAPSLNRPELCAIYRKMMEHPAIVAARGKIETEMRKVAWEYRAESPATKDMADAVSRWMEPHRWDFLKWALSVLDYGYAAFEPLYFLNAKGAFCLKKFKALKPDVSNALVDKESGAFAGVRNGDVELDANKGLWVFIPTPAERFAPVGRGQSRLEPVRSIWQRWRNGEKVADLDRQLHDSYCGGPGEEHIRYTVVTIAEASLGSLNRVAGTLARGNFGEGAESVWLAYTLPEVAKAAKGEGVAETNTGGKNRKGRLSKEDAKAKRATLRALITEHASMKYDYATLAFQVGISPDTARRWVGADDETYAKSKAAGPPKPR